MTDLKETMEHIERLADERNLSAVDKEAAEILARREIQSESEPEIEAERMAKYALNSLEQKSHL